MPKLNEIQMHIEIKRNPNLVVLYSWPKITNLMEGKFKFQNLNKRNKRNWSKNGEHASHTWSYFP